MSEQQASESGREDRDRDQGRGVVVTLDANYAAGDGVVKDHGSLVVSGAEIAGYVWACGVCGCQGRGDFKWDEAFARYHRRSAMVKLCSCAGDLAVVGWGPWGEHQAYYLWHGRWVRGEVCEQGATVVAEAADLFPWMEAFFGPMSRGMGESFG